MSLFDIDDAIGGEQPVGFDQFSNLYGNYRVSNCLLTATFENADDSARVLTILPSPGSSNTRSLSNTLSLPHCVSVVIPSKGSGVNIRSVSQRMSAE